MQLPLLIGKTSGAIARHASTLRSSIAPKPTRPASSGLPIPIASVGVASRKQLWTNHGRTRSISARLSPKEIESRQLRRRLLLSSDESAKAVFSARKKCQRIYHRSAPVILNRFLRTREKISVSWFSLNYVCQDRPKRHRLTAILIKVLQLADNPTLENFPGFSPEDLETLTRCGYTLHDVKQWAWIIEPRDANEMAQRYLSVSRAPNFILLEILRDHHLQPKTLKSLLLHTWYRLTRAEWKPDESISEAELESLLKILGSQVSISPDGKAFIQETTFLTLLSRFSVQCRRHWPPALVSLSHMAALYLKRLGGGSPADNKPLDGRAHARLSLVLNRFIRIFALPASASPFASTVYNWHALRVVIAKTRDFSPALTIDQTSYRAVASVLLALQKSEKEAKSSIRMVREWPPWQEDLDGVDAERPPEDNFSRAHQAVMLMKQAGYTSSGFDNALAILAGREQDLSPTIQTRSIMIAHSGTPTEKDQTNGARRGMSPNRSWEWAARINTTRDVQEAWAAFRGYERSKAEPSLRIYRAMFEKLKFDDARQGREHEFEALPGDGKEVIAPDQSNLSREEKLRRRPQELNTLYRHMLRRGLRPQGECLDFLVSTADTLRKGIEYLEDSDVSKSQLDCLLGMKSGPHLFQIRRQTFNAFVELLCRMSVLVSQGWKNQNHKDTGASHLRILNDNGLPDVAYEDSAIFIPSRDSKIKPLILAVELLNVRKPADRAPWYSLFSALTHRHVSVLGGKHTRAEHDIIGFQIFLSSLANFHKTGLQLDPAGLLHLCRALERAIHASRQLNHGLVEATIENGRQAVKSAWTQLSSSGEKILELPRLYYVINGAHLHAYIRVLGLLGDKKGILDVLEWMTRHEEELMDTAEQYRNGKRSLGKCLVAMRVFLDEESAKMARGIVARSGCWYWPSKEAAEEYARNGSGNSAYGTGQEEQGKVDAVEDEDSTQKEASGGNGEETLDESPDRRVDEQPERAAAPTGKGANAACGG